MDFHSLPRRELQSLCKKNKIPANMTNVSMADALKALIHVEGLEDILNQTEFNPLQSPENPRTARRKPSNAESGSSKSLISAHRASRRKTAEEVKEENKNVNVPETPAAPTTRRRATVHSARQKVEIHLEEAEEGQEKMDVPETLVVPTSRRRAPATSTRRKVDGEEDEGSVQRVYSTRRSVRLLEKSMSGLSLKEQRRTEPIKMIEYAENEGKKETFESVQATDGLENSGQISDSLLEEDLNDSRDFSVVEGSAVPEKVSAEIMEHATDSQSSPQHGKNDSKKGELMFFSDHDESKIVDCQQLACANPDHEPKYATDEESKADESQEKPNGFLQENGNGEVSKGIASQEKPSDFHQENGNGEVSKDIASQEKPSNLHQENGNGEVSKDIASQEKPSDLHHENGNGEVSKDIASQEKPSDFHQENGNGEVSKDIASLLSEVEYESAKGSETLPEVSESCDVNDFPDDSSAEDYSGSGSSFELIAVSKDIASQEKPSDFHQENGNGEVSKDIASQEKPSDFHQENGNGEVSKDIASQEKPSDFHQENGNGEVSKDIASLLSEVEYESAKGSKTLPEVSESCDVNDFPDDLSAEDYSGSGSSFEHIADEITEEDSINADNVETLSCLLENNTDGPDADVREELNFTSTLSDKASEFVKQISPTYPLVSEGKAEDPIALPKMGAYGSRALIVNVAKSEEFGTHENLPSLDKTPSRGRGIGQNAQFSPDSIPGQFPRPNLASTEKQTTFPMMTQDSGINKENYDMISCDLEIKKNGMRKEKNVIALEGESIRSLKKMLKRNLMINESTKDKDSNFTKQEGKTRPALQKLPENCMPVADPVEM